MFRHVSTATKMNASIELTSELELTLTEAQICDRLTRNLKRIPTRRTASNRPVSRMTPAAVLIPLISINHAWHVLYIRRATNINDHHSGQVAFPGGRHDPEDVDMETTALREANEEIGLMPQDVRVIGCLNEHYSTTDYRIRPVVGAIPWPYSLRIEKKEVSRWFTIPFDWLANPDNREIRHQQSSAGEPHIPTIYFRNYQGEHLWGASAKITVELLETLEG